MNTKKLVIAGAAVVLIIGIYLNSARAKSQREAQGATPTIAEINNSMNYITPDSKLQIEDIKVGEGREVKSGDRIVIHYKGTLTDGTPFDSSYDRGKPFETQIGVGSVIQGWDQGVPGMKIGGKRKLTIPPELGYGDQGAGDVIPPGATLVFEVELVDIK